MSNNPRKPYPKVRQPRKTVFTPALWIQWRAEQGWPKDPADRTTLRCERALRNSVSVWDWLAIDRYSRERRDCVHPHPGALALAKALELQRLLEAVCEAEDEPGSPPEEALSTLRDVIGYLTPFDNDLED